jgi:hypothetical protein
MMLGSARSLGTHSNTLAHGLDLALRRFFGLQYPCPKGEQAGLPVTNLYISAEMHGNTHKKNHSKAVKR